MKKEIKGFICGMIATSLLGCVSISAAGVWDKIDVLRNDINVVVNGTPVNADNFLYNDTTYLPMRVVAETLGKEVQYDENTNTATIKDKGDDNLINSEQVKYVPSNDLINDPHSLIYFYNNIYYIKPDEIYFLALEKQMPTNVQDVAGNSNMDLILGDRTWKMQWVDEVHIRRGIPFDIFIDEILPYLGIDPAPYIK